MYLTMHQLAELSHPSPVTDLVILFKLIVSGDHLIVDILSCMIVCVCVCVDEYWVTHPELHDIPIYYASSLAQKCMAGKVSSL